MSDRVLIVEDEPLVRESMADVLRTEGIDVVLASSVDEAEQVLSREQVGAVLTDLRMPGRTGIELLRNHGEGDVPVVVITGHGTVDDAVAAMKAGAYDFVQKPADPEQLVIVVRRAVEHGRLLDEVTRLRSAVQRDQRKRSLAGSSATMARIRQLVEQVAPTSATVLVTGESGTGKELVVADIHRKSPRSQGPLIQVNCAAVPESLFESEFFGHRRGAFSGAHTDRTGRFAEAQSGTLALDEIETLQLDVQAKLLRVLETGEYQMVGDSRTRVVDVRVIAVSNENLEARVQAGNFRRDLYYRLNVFPIHLPPLRTHREDIPEIARELFSRVRVRAGATDSPYLSDDALSVLKAYDWPGNVRELRNVLERAVILTGPGGCVDGALLQELLGPGFHGIAARSDAGNDQGLRARMDAVERELVKEALERAGGSKKEAARVLGVDPKNLSYYVRKHGLQEDGGSA